MGRGDKKTQKGKRTIGSYGNSRNRKKIKAQLKRKASKKSVPAADSKPKARKTAKKKEE